MHSDWVLGSMRYRNAGGPPASARITHNGMLATPTLTSGRWGWSRGRWGGQSIRASSTETRAYKAEG